MELSALLKPLQQEVTKETLSEIEVRLADYINNLIQTDFNKLLHLLYRVDVSEQKLKTLLQNEKERDAATIIAALMIQRELEKAEARKTFKGKPPIDEDEKW
ncbi:MAG TPA: hypothetical protein VM888_12750 [Chitinophagaceae bacterium]|nr:hypothetical protein [Chitinophagaceae bacterium]